MLDRSCGDYQNPGARSTDYICRIHGIGQAAVVRFDKKEETLRVIGTAALPHPRYKSRAAKGGSDGSKFETADFDFIPDTEMLELFMDAALAYEFLT